MPAFNEYELLAVVRASESVEPFDDPIVELVSDAGLTALLGRDWPVGDEVERALLHDDVVSEVQQECSALIPFRSGSRFTRMDDVRAMLRTHQRRFCSLLTRFSGRVEMGLKLRLPRDPNQPLSAPSFPELDDIRSLARGRRDCRERHTPFSDHSILAGQYLVANEAVEQFWETFERLQRRVHLHSHQRTRGPIGQAAALGSGPWAPYSFCSAQTA